MAWVPEGIALLAEQAKAGQQPRISVRELLRHFRSYRRGQWVVRMVRNGLDEAGVVTTPDFNIMHLDAQVSLVPKPAPQNRIHDGEVGEKPGSAPEAEPVVVATEDEREMEARHRLSRLLDPANAPVSVVPDDTVAKAITIMLTRDFSQLPVMQKERDVKGAFSWKSYGERMAMGLPCALVRDCMFQPKELGEDASIFEAVRVIAENDFVLVRDSTRRVAGIVTASDITRQFQQLAEPFMLLGEIENQIRIMMAQKFSKEDLQAAKDPNDTERTVAEVSDLTFGEYIRLLENPAKWDKLELKFDRGTFVNFLEEIRQIRNDVMHFDPDGIEAAGLRKLRDFARFLEQVQRLTEN